MSTVAVTAARRRLLTGITGTLATYPHLADAEASRSFLNGVADALPQPPPAWGHPLSRPHLADLVRLCAATDGAMEALADSLATIGLTDRQLAPLRRLVDEWNARRLYPAGDWSALHAVLSELPADEVARDVGEVTDGRQQSVPAHCGTAFAVFTDLTGVNTRPDGLAPSLLLLELLGHRLREQDAAKAEAIRRWLRDQPIGPRTREALRSAARTLAATAPRAGPDCYLLIQLEEESPDGSSYYVRSWQHSNPQRWTPVPGSRRVVPRERLARAVAYRVKEAESDWAATTHTVRLEFLLPWSLLDEPVDRWLAEADADPPVTLGMRYPVVVRSLDRMRTPQWHRSWRRRWRMLAEHTAVSEPRWSVPDGPDYLSRLQADLLEDERVVALVLSEPPGHADGLGRRELIAAMRAGLPIVVWNRADGAHEAFRDVVGRLFADRGLVNLPVNTQQWRLNAVRDPRSSDSHALHDLAVLWDDPGRQPDTSGLASGLGGGGR